MSEHWNNPDVRDLTTLCGLSRRFVQAEGLWLTADDGRRFLDAYAQFGAVILGHNAAPVRDAVSAALGARMPAMVQPHPAEHAEALGRALGDLVPGRPPRCVITTSGAEAVEAAIKLVRARSGRPVILSAAGSFHGRTLGALAATGQAHHQTGFGPLPPAFDTVPFGDSEALAARLARDAGKIAAYFVEPVQGEGGVIVPPAGYLSEVRALCDRHGVALVVDEIQTGLGRTGPVFAVTGQGVAPDVLLTAKGLGGGLFPLGACLVADDWWTSRFALGHSSTFANNNVACAVGRAVLATLLERPGTGDATLLEQAAAQGLRLGAGLQRLRLRFPDLIQDVRGQGLLWAIELAPPRDRDGLILGYLTHQGLLAYAVASALAETTSVLTLPALGARHVLRLSPPLVIDGAEVDLILDGLATLFARLRAQGAQALLRGMRWMDTALAPDSPAPARPWVSLPHTAPAARSVRSSRRRWAFLAHYTRPRDVGDSDPSLAGLSEAETLQLCEHAARLPPGIMLEAPPVRSSTGAVVEGWVIGLPWLPVHLRRRGRRTREAIQQGVDLAIGLGADVVGLGGFTAPLSDRGLAVAGRGATITSGNVLTAGMAVQAVTREAQRRGLDLRRARVAVVGARGSVGALAARLLARWRPARLRLVGNPDSPRAPLQELASRITWPGGAAEPSAFDALWSCDVIVSASGAGRAVLGDLELATHTIVCDIARPPDAPLALRRRRDMVVIDGGLVRLPDRSLTFGPGNLQGLPPGVVLACMAETLLHALDGTTVDTGLGRDVPVEQVDRVMAMAARHGFELWDAADDAEITPRDAALPLEEVRA